MKEGHLGPEDTKEASSSSHARGHNPEQKDIDTIGMNLAFHSHTWCMLHVKPHV